MRRLAREKGGGREMSSQQREEMTMDDNGRPSWPPFFAMLNKSAFFLFQRDDQTYLGQDISFKCYGYTSAMGFCFGLHSYYANTT